MFMKDIHYLKLICLKLTNLYIFYLTLRMDNKQLTDLKTVNQMKVIWNSKHHEFLNLPLVHVYVERINLMVKIHLDRLLNYNCVHITVHNSLSLHFTNITNILYILLLYFINSSFSFILLNVLKYYKCLCCDYFSRKTGVCDVGTSNFATLA